MPVRTPRNLPCETSRCLNGWWDFIPLQEAPGSPADPGLPPGSGWLDQAVLVPSWWTRHLEVETAEGLLTCRPNLAALKDDDRLLFDTWDYPRAWAACRAGWLRRRFSVDPARPGRRRWLRLEAVMPQCWVYLDGRLLGHHCDPCLPVEFPVEELLAPGEHELAVRVADWPRAADGRVLCPTGNGLIHFGSGIWQDVSLVERSSLRVAQVTVRTSVRRGELELAWELANDGARPVEARLEADVVRWARGLAAADAAPLLAIPAQKVAIPAGGRALLACTVPWRDAARWEPGDPALHLLRSRLGDADLHLQRFGFREVWIDGPDLMLNGRPVHLFGEWGHKFTPYHHQEGWIRQWFGMLRRANMNHIRVFSHPHPPLLLELADEEGILVTAETGINGAGGQLAGDDQAFWDACADHVRALVRRDGNHPSVVMWSVENEFRWNFDKTRLCMRELPRLRRLFKELDPTREAYHDGDSSLWGDADQPIISRHYGKDCSGLGWWDRSRPLHSGETAIYHYSGPNNTLHLGGDAVFADVRAVDEACARDLQLVVEAGRTQGVCSFGPWNLSCIQNLRPHPEVRLAWSDWSAPGIKPLRIAADTSEFRFWEGGPGFAPGPGFARQAAAFRPVALIDHRMRQGYPAGSRAGRQLHVVNDGPADLAGRVVAEWTCAGRLLGRCEAPVAVARGRVAAVAVAVDLPAGLEGTVEYHARLEVDGQQRDGWSRAWRVAPPPRPRLGRGLAVHGDGSAAPLLAALGLAARRLAALDAASLAGVGLLLVERGAIRPGSDANRVLQAFARGGGRVLLLEQEQSLFPGLPLEGKAAATAFIRAPGHPVFAGLGDEDLAWWGDDAYAVVNPDTLVCERLYRKDDGAATLVLADAGEGGFGNGTLDRAALLAVAEGEGLVLASQFLLTSKGLAHPAALRLFANLLEHCDRYATPAPGRVRAAAPGESIAGLLAEARAGAVVALPALDAEALAAWGRALGLPLRGIAGRWWQAVKADPAHPLVAGLSHEDGCGIERWTYCDAEHKNFPVASLAIEPCPGLEPLWTTPTTALLAEMFEHGGRAEVLRSTLRTRTYRGEHPPARVLIGLLHCGAGALLFDQVQPPRQTDGSPARRRLLRPRARVLANLGLRPTASPLDGPCTPEPPGQSQGFPLRLRLLDAAADEGQLLADCVFNPERMLSTPITGRGAWRTAESSDGLFASTGARWAYLVLHSPVQRKNVLTNLGVPNPGAQTFCDLGGSGACALAVNGKWHQELVLPGTATEIPLEAGFNHLLLRLDGVAELGIRFRNIERRAETGFTFP